LFCIAAPQDPRERPSEDGVAWNSLTRVVTHVVIGTVELSYGGPALYTPTCTCTYTRLSR